MGSSIYIPGFRTSDRLPCFEACTKKPIECVRIELNSKSITQVTLHEKPQERQDIHHHQGGKGEVSCGACKRWEKIESEKGKGLNKLSGPKDYN